VPISPDQLPDDTQALKRIIAAMAQDAVAAQAEIAKLRFQLARYRRAEFGRSSEKLAREAEQLETKPLRVTPPETWHKRLFILCFCCVRCNIAPSGAELFLGLGVRCCISKRPRSRLREDQRTGARSSSISVASAGATTRPKPTFKSDHQAGAGHAAPASYRRTEYWHSGQRLASRALQASS